MLDIPLKRFNHVLSFTSCKLIPEVVLLHTIWALRHSQHSKVSENGIQVVGHEHVEIVNLKLLLAINSISGNLHLQIKAFDRNISMNLMVWPYC